MTQITTGIRSILSNPTMYEAVQRIMGAHSLRKYIVEQYVTPHKVERILDIGCGPADILSYLPDIEYYGFDISEQYINEAKSKYGNRGVFSSEYLTSSDLDILPKFDMVILIGVLHHLDDADAANIIGLAHKALGAGGRLVTIDGCLVDGQNPIARKLIQLDRGQNIREEEGYYQLVKSTFKNIDVSIKHRAWIPYTYCFMECNVD